MKNVAVIGSSSMVGSRFCDLSDSFNLIKGDLNGDNQIDITNKNSVKEFFDRNNFECAILFSAYTDVDGAQKENNNNSGLCWKLNVDGAKNVVDACKEKNTKLILISTDFVFDGENGPYEEIESVNQNTKKIGWYGHTKSLSEKEVSTLQNFIILRISYPYRANFEQKDDFAKNILTRYKNGNLFPLFCDQQFTPTFTDDLAPAIKLLINTESKGIFHVASPETTTPYDFGCALISKFGGDPKEVEKASVIGFLKDPNTTPRPQKGGLRSNKIQKLGFKPTSWKDGIDKLFEQTNKN